MFEVLGRRPSDQSGSALLIVAVIIGVLGVMSVLMFAYPDTEQKNDKELALEATYGRFVTSIQQQMVDPAYCTGHLLNLGAPPIYPPRGISTVQLPPYPPNQWGAEITLYNMNIAGTTTSAGAPLTTISANTRLGPGLPLIKGVELRVAQNSYQTVRIDRGEPWSVNSSPPITLKKYRARLYIIPDVTDPKGFTPHSWNVNDCTGGPNCVVDGPNGPNQNFLPAVDPSKVVDLSLQVDINNSNKIYGCFGADSYAEFCDEQGQGWDSQETNPLYRCQPDTLCFSDTNVVNSPASCIYPYIASQVGIVGSNTYVCQWCNGSYTHSPYHNKVGYY